MWACRCTATWVVDMTTNWLPRRSNAKFNSSFTQLLVENKVNTIIFITEWQSSLASELPIYFSPYWRIVITWDMELNHPILLVDGEWIRVDNANTEIRSGEIRVTLGQTERLLSEVEAVILCSYCSYTCEIGEQKWCLVPVHEVHSWFMAGASSHKGFSG